MVIKAYGMSFILTATGVVCSLALTTCLAYGLSKKGLPGRNVLTFLVFFTMLFNGGLVPTYINYTTVFHVKDTFFGLLVPSLMMSAFNVLLMKSYFVTGVPDEILEAAYIDGANEFQTMWKIAIPLSKPIIAVEALYYGVARWNSFTTEMIYLRSQSKYPLALVLRQLLWSIESIKAMLNGGDVDMSNISEEMRKYLEQRADTASIMQYCMIIVSCIPMMIIYPALQKYFAKGVMIGAVKG